ncbi:MAG: class D sortase [Myxococcales bacterium]|nr:class D sortase [Myxococcales bacterium]MDH5567983.1 class D sortase [Myxococcales bacterium]
MRVGKSDMTNAPLRAGGRLTRASARARRARALRACEYALWILGVACLGVYALACAQASWTQAREREAFLRALAEIERLEVDHSEWSSERIRQFADSRGAPHEALARLDVPAAGIRVMVLAGTDEWTLNRGVGHIEGTALPGETGNVGIAGHRDGFFRGLRHLEVGDVLQLSTLEGVGTYEVIEIRVVDPSDVEVLAATEEPSVTLVTCYPFYFVGDAPKRFIVRARQSRVEAWSSHLGSLGEASGAAPAGI